MIEISKSLVDNTEELTGPATDESTLIIATYAANYFWEFFEEAFQNPSGSVFWGKKYQSITGDRHFRGPGNDLDKMMGRRPSKIC